MPRPFRLIVLLLISCVLTASVGAEPALKVGDPAPPLAQGEYVKGEPVREFEKGKIYVVEF
jgi:hypothetical protein